VQSVDHGVLVSLAPVASAPTHWRWRNAALQTTMASSARLDQEARFAIDPTTAFALFDSDAPPPEDIPARRKRISKTSFRMPSPLN
jgi:hypothetical protein